MKQGEKFKRILTFFMSVVLVLTMFLSDLGVQIVRADEGVTIRLHYHREDGDYEPWDVWMWPDGGEGAGYPFEEEDGEI